MDTSLNTPVPSPSSSSSSSSVTNQTTLKTNAFDSSSDEEVFIPSQAKKLKVLSASEDDIDEDGNPSVNDEKPSLKKFKIQQRCVDSSDEENVDLNVGLLKTPKVEREKKLLEMRKKVRAKKGLYSSGDESNGYQDTGPDNSGDDLDDFVVDDNVVEMEEEKESEELSEEDRGVKQKKRKSKRNSKQKRGKPADAYVYVNPYKEMNDQFEDIDVMEVLSKKTEKDKRNTWRYMEEIGKYHEPDGDQDSDPGTSGDDVNIGNDLEDFVVKESEERSYGDQDIGPGSSGDTMLFEKSKEQVCNSGSLQLLGAGWQVDADASDRDYSSDGEATQPLDYHISIDALEKDIEDYGKLISLNNDKIERLERVLIAHRKGTNQNS